MSGLSHWRAVIQITALPSNGLRFKSQLCVALGKRLKLSCLVYKMEIMGTLNRN